MLEGSQLNTDLPMNRVPAYLLGQAQRSYHAVESAPHPAVMMQDIARQALQDAGLQPADVDAVGCVDPFSWTYANLAVQVANDIGCTPGVREFWSPAGGTTPQDLIHQIAQAMAAEEVDVAVLFGAEAMRTRRKATRAGNKLPWPPRDKSIDPMRGQPPFTSDWEAQHGLRLPIQTFPVNENALRHAHGRSAAEQLELAAYLLNKNAQVATNNPHAWFKDAPSAASISTVTEDNRMIAYPYTKRMNAIMDVDQAAALVLVSHRYLDANGLASRAAAVLGGAGAEEIWNPLQRPNLARSVPMEKAFAWALEAAGLAAGDIDAFDLYSCFPSPVQMALAAMGLSVEDERPFSITGGLAYAGGPGNNYVMHSLATALQHIRANPMQKLMITGVGMANTKHAATVLSHAQAIPDQASGNTLYRLETGEQAVPVAEQATGPCHVVSYTIEYSRSGEATNVIYLLDTADGHRAIANARDPVQEENKLLQADPIGQHGVLEWDAEQKRQYFVLEG